MALREIRPIQFHTLQEHIAESLRERIIAGSLPPGARIVEARFCAELGISRTPLRESLRLLQAEGLVTLRPGRGAFVTVVTERDIADLFDILSALERQAASKAVLKMSIADRARLRRMHDNMIKLYREGSLRECFQADQAVHNLLVEKADNPVLMSTHRSLQLRARRGRYVALFSRARWDEAMREHEEFMEAVERRDGEAVGTLIHRHVAQTGTVLRQTLAAQGVCAVPQGA